MTRRATMTMKMTAVKSTLALAGLVISAVAGAAACGSQPAAAPPATAAAAAAPAGQPPPKLTAPVSLFNGRDLTGWVQVLDSKWTVEDGVLVGRQDPAGRR